MDHQRFIGSFDHDADRHASSMAEYFGREMQSGACCAPGASPVKGMIYTPMTKRALRIAFDAHKEQVDKTGLPYVFHPFHLAEQMADEASICAALLHDVVEDTPMTFEQLSQAGISDEVLSALRLLTHQPSVPYMDYIQRIKDSHNRIAIAVKLADLHHNADPMRLEGLDDAMRSRIQKYKAAIALLEPKAREVPI